MFRTPEGGRELGIVVDWGLGNKYGFIRRSSDPKGGHVFVHAAELEADVRYPLDPGTRVSFTVAAGAKGLRAQRVRPEPAKA